MSQIHIWQLNKHLTHQKYVVNVFSTSCFLLDELDELQRLMIRHFFFQPLLTRFDSKFDMREACCWSSNDVYKNSSSSRIEKEWLGNVPLPLKIFNDQILDPFLPIPPVEHELGGTRRGFFPTVDKLQIQCRDQRKSFERTV